MAWIKINFNHSINHAKLFKIYIKLFYAIMWCLFKKYFKIIKFLKCEFKRANLFAFSHLRDCFATKAVVVWVYLIDDYYNVCFIFA